MCEFASPLAIAEWIEISYCDREVMDMQSPLAIAEWIEILPQQPVPPPGRSPLAIAEWIEIPLIDLIKSIRAVSASDSGVD